MGTLHNLGGVVDLQARVTNRKLREIAAQATLERDKALDHIETLGRALGALSELTAEARGLLGDMSPDEGDKATAKQVDDLVRRITEALGE